MKIDLTLADDILKDALDRGATEAEVFMKSSKNLSVEVKNQDVDALKSSLSFGYSLRVVKNGCLGFSYSTDTAQRGDVVVKALESASYTVRDGHLVLPGPTGDSPVEVFDPELEALKEEEAISRVMLLERSTYGEDERIRKIRKASGSFTLSETAIVNSKSVRTAYRSSACSAQVTAVAEEGSESQIGWDFGGSRFLGDLQFEKIGKTAAGRALRLLGSRKMEGRRAAVILDNSVTADFLGVFGSLLSSDAVQKGKSLLKERLQQRVISPRISIIDSGTLPRRLGSRPADDEGVASQENIMISEGVLLTYLYNTYTARKGAENSTGNAVRGSFASLPGVGPANLYIEPASKEEVVRKDGLFGALGQGLYVVDVMGLHTANPISGEFSVGAAGIWIERGEAQYPIKEAVISGNLLEIFSRVQAVGDDLTFFGNVGAPSLIVSDIDISA